MRSSRSEWDTTSDTAVWKEYKKSPITLTRKRTKTNFHRKHDNMESKNTILNSRVKSWKIQPEFYKIGISDKTVGSRYTKSAGWVNSRARVLHQNKILFPPIRLMTCISLIGDSRAQCVLTLGSGVELHSWRASSKFKKWWLTFCVSC